MAVFKATDVSKAQKDFCDLVVKHQQDISYREFMNNMGAYYRYTDYSKKLTNYKPKQIIFQPDLKTTVVIWEDESRTVVKCSGNEEFVPEIGFAMALVKKIFPNRSEFLRMIDGAYVQPARNKKTSNKNVPVVADDNASAKKELGEAILDFIDKMDKIT